MRKLIILIVLAAIYLTGCAPSMDPRVDFVPTPGLKKLTMIEKGKLIFDANNHFVMVEGKGSKSGKIYDAKRLSLIHEGLITADLLNKYGLSYKYVNGSFKHFNARINGKTLHLAFPNKNEYTIELLGDYLDIISAVDIEGHKVFINAITENNNDLIIYDKTNASIKKVNLYSFDSAKNSVGLSFGTSHLAPLNVGYHLNFGSIIYDREKKYVYLGSSTLRFMKQNALLGPERTDARSSFYVFDIEGNELSKIKKDGLDNYEVYGGLQQAKDKLLLVKTATSHFLSKETAQRYQEQDTKYAIGGNAYNIFYSDGKSVYYK